MKQLVFDLADVSQLDAYISEIKECEVPRSMLLHMYCGIQDTEVIFGIRKRLVEAFPDAAIVGTTCNGEIMHGRLTEPTIVLSALLFYSTDVKVYYFNTLLGHEKDIGTSVRTIIEGTPDIAAAEIIVQRVPADVRSVLNEIEKCDKSITIFGGFPIGHDIDNDRPQIILENEASIDALALVTFAGKDFHINSTHTAGWKTLGRKFRIDKASGNKLYEVDGMPASDLFSRYLRIEPDENFVRNTMEFPLMLESEAGQTLRHPAHLAKESGYIDLAGDVSTDQTVSMTYGDPTEIVEKVNARCEEIREFKPEAILLHSCAMRKIFWGPDVDSELEPFEKLAPTAGFFTGGELDRDLNTGKMLWHNITLISIAMREGDKPEREFPKVSVNMENVGEEMQLVRRLTNLVRETNIDLGETMQRLIDTNSQLEKQATVDELTGLYNRRKIESEINARLDKTARDLMPVSLVMLDIDHFKKVNDICGHFIGDCVLKQLSEILMNSVDAERGEMAGRWGGEEFFILLPGADESEVLERAEELRKRVEESSFPAVRRVTISLGVITTTGGIDHQKIYTEVDNALYKAKDSGRNRVCVADTSKL